MLALLAFPAAFALLPTLAAGAASNKALTAGAGANATSAAASSPSTAASAAAGQSGVSATSTGACANPGPVAGVQGMLKQFPPLYVTAKIVAGDTVAQQLFQSITSNQTYAKALAFPPTVVHDYNPVFTGYNQNSDPACWWSDTNCVKPKQPYLPNDWVTCREGDVWGHTVDDGPLPAHCHLYELFRENNLAPSLFYIGSNVLANPASAAEGLALGSPICVHTFSHHTTSLSTESVFAELYYTKLAIKRVLGVTPRCWRPPYGDVDDRVRTIAYALELDTWDNDTNDWQLGTGAGELPQPAIQANFDQIIGNATSAHGTIVLDHELSVPIANMFITNYPRIKTAFKHVVSGHTCNNQTSPYAEQTPLYPDMANWLNGAKPAGNLVAKVDPTADIVWIGTGAPRNLPFPASSASLSNSNATVNAAGSAPLIGAANGTLPSAAAASAPASASASATSKTGAASSLRPFGLPVVVFAALGALVRA